MISCSMATSKLSAAMAFATLFSSHILYIYAFQQSHIVLRRTAIAPRPVVHGRISSSSQNIITKHHTLKTSTFHRHHHHHHIPSTTSLLLSNTNNNIDNDNTQQIDSLIYRTSKVLRASSWFSWWSQVILTVISSITFLFARNVMEAQSPFGSSISFNTVASKFLLPGLGIVTSCISIIWTWGQRRLSRRFVRRPSTSRVEAANLLRRVIKVGVALNLVGLLLSVLGSQYIVGTLVAKSMTSFVGGGFGGGGVVTSQTLQPLDVLVVQANTNVLSSHFVSLACLLWLSRMVDQLDPPSLEDDE